MRRCSDFPQAKENQSLLVLFRVETGYRSYGNFIEKKKKNNYEMLKLHYQQQRDLALG